MKVLITGGAGFLGAHLGDAFIARGDNVICMDTGSIAKIRHNLGHPNFTFVHDSVLNEAMVDALVGQADLVYHLAAVVGVEHYVADPYAVLNVNINGMQVVLRAAYRHGKKVIFSSTSEVYGRNPRIPWSEDDDRVLGSTRIDRWCYSTSKAASEHFCFAYRKLGLPVVVLRYFNAYGPRLDALDRGRVITIFLGKALRNEPITVVGDGLQTRCFTYVSDAIRATVEAGLREKAIGEIINIGSNVETTMRDLAEMVARLSGSKSEIVFVPQETVYGTSYEDVPRRVPDTMRMETLLGVKAETPLEEGLRHTIDYFRRLTSDTAAATP
jgi:UDP-glucose 4-epimerase